MFFSKEKLEIIYSKFQAKELPHDKQSNLSKYISQIIKLQYLMSKAILFVDLVCTSPIQSCMQNKIARKKNAKFNVMNDKFSISSTNVVHTLCMYMIIFLYPS